jgi:metal-responsive CopG/Arc/MetJ family transcriptional regulator
MANSNSRTVKRGAHPKRTSEIVTFSMPKTWVPLLDQRVIAEDSDRSKIIRRALSEKLGVPLG